MGLTNKTLDELSIGNEDHLKVPELSNKILPLLEGYTINQIEKSFDRLSDAVKKGLELQFPPNNPQKQ